MPDVTTAESSAPDLFFENLPENFVFPADAVGRRLMQEYGAVFVARGGAVAPKTVIFRNEKEVAKFQASLSIKKNQISGFEIELQTAAMEILENTVAEAESCYLSITPRGTDSARRSYTETVSLWASRVNPGLTHWFNEGKLSETEGAKIQRLSPFEQVSEILELEANGLFFSKDLSKSIVYSVAPPGSSQHLSMLALDINEHDNPLVRNILCAHDWFQTVVSDLPHFTFLGVSEIQLPDLGLKQILSGNRIFWIPDL